MTYFPELVMKYCGDCQQDRNNFCCPNLRIDEEPKTLLPKRRGALELNPTHRETRPVAASFVRQSHCGKAKLHFLVGAFRVTSRDALRLTAHIARMTVTKLLIYLNCHSYPSRVRF